MWWLYVILGVVVIAIIIVILVLVHHRNKEKEADKKVIHSTDATRINPKKDKGAKTEDLASRMLSRLDIPEKAVFQNLMIPYAGDYQEIDNIVLTRKGIFIIECKDWNGSVKGNENDETVIQLDVSGRYPHERPNPIKTIHVKERALSKYLKIDAEKFIIPVIAFTSSNIFLSSQSVYIVRFQSLDGYIKQRYNKQIVLMSESIYNRVYASFKDLADHPPITIEEHINDIKEKYKD